jgi:hypothetical protein
LSPRVTAKLRLGRGCSVKRSPSRTQRLKPRSQKHFRRSWVCTSLRLKIWTARKREVLSLYFPPTVPMLGSFPQAKSAAHRQGGHLGRARCVGRALTSSACWCAWRVSRRTQKPNGFDHFLEPLAGRERCLCATEQKRWVSVRDVCETCVRCTKTQAFPCET